MTTTALADEFLAQTRAAFVRAREQAERAAAQVGDEHFFAAPDPESNSIALTMKHMGGNLRSRFTDFLLADGEKADRDRDGEFELRGDTRDGIMAGWSAGWETLLRALDSLGADDLLATVHIRGEPHSVVQALQRALAHASYHSGQIVQLAKHYAGDAWKTLSIPRGQSGSFTPAALSAPR